MSIRVKLVGLLKEYAPQGDGVNLEGGGGRTVAEVMADLRIPLASVSITLVNGRHVKDQDYVLEEGDELTLLPPIGGGQGETGMVLHLKREDAKACGRSSPSE